ncbi:MAG: hypothetical protein HYU87_09250, partial [Chloroflexi bacterium]|nr:hypothetical protein [Chloroflexota bacterium]
VAEIKFQTARALRALGNKKRAAEVLADALRTAGAAGNESLAVRIEAFMAWSDVQDGNAVEAQRRLEELIPRADKTEPEAQFAVRFTLAKTLRQDDPARAVEILRELAASLEQRSAPSVAADVYAELSKALASQGLSEEALLYAQRAYKTSLKAKGGV